MKKTNDITELVFILDRSGSMGGLESDTIGGFNALIDKQKKIDGKCFVTTVLFDHESVMIHDRLPLEKVTKMTEKEYQVRGCTALLDAIGDGICHIESIHKYIRKEDIPSHVMFVVTTDGMENASKKYSSAKVKKMIRSKEEVGWEFLFIGANIDAVETASNIGIRTENAVNYKADKKGTQVLYKAVNCAVESMRAMGCADSSWRKAIDEDMEERGS